jgi:hypothetical protein
MRQYRTCPKRLERVLEIRKVANPSTRKLLENQGYHLLAWIVIGVLLYLESRRIIDSSTVRIWNLSAAKWLLASWIFAAFHQGWVWFFWRLELYSGQITSWFGPRGFHLYCIGFALFASVRLISLIPVSMATAGTLLMPRTLSLGLIIVTTPPIIWGLYSVVAYFGVTRAFGADHFDEKYRGGALEVRGIFRYVPNAMYTVVLLALYHPGLLVHSRLGLIAALAHHLLVWTHYFCTERPDMREIYGTKKGTGRKEIG